LIRECVMDILIRECVMDACLAYFD
jgi:hypothetical protein